ncbi:ribosomal protein L7A/L8 [Artemisia annua]|uniref:Ribosomal protein L7A/L8 n=1 Tax=Artemisia annua TaxID=35608 RepID=A0A2U1MPR3_ARTAN|nr:ribosomal protein L7A/L8 [Artemisia annua]
MQLYSTRQFVTGVDVSAGPKEMREEQKFATKKKTEKVVNPLFEKRPKQFGISIALPPNKDVHRSLGFTTNSIYVMKSHGRGAQAGYAADWIHGVYLSNWLLGYAWKLGCVTPYWLSSVRISFPNLLIGTLILAIVFVVLVAHGS